MVKKSDFIFSILVIILFFLVILGINTNVLYSLGFIPGYVSSYSMEPTLHIGDALIIMKTRPGDLKIGDIIVYQRFNSKIVHRIINKTSINGSYRFLIKGDANSCPDPGMISRDPSTWLKEQYILGKVVIVIPYIGVIPLYLEKNTIAYYTILSILVLTFFFTLLNDLFRNKSSEN